MYRFARILAFSLLLCTLFTLFCGLIARTEGSLDAKVGALPAPQKAAPATSAASAALYDPRSDCFLVAKNADERRPMASTTKIMTALLVLEHCELSATVKIPPEAVGIEGSSIYLFAGEEITVETLLYGLLLSSANDAATALALHVAGSVEAFALRMNERAAALGLQNTHFKNPHGLPDDEHYTTARELALLAAAAMENEAFAKIASTKRYEAAQNGTDATRLFLNHNRLLRTYEGAVGVKTGFTRASGRCLVSAAERGGLRLIAVTLNAPDDWRDHTALFDWGFSEYEGFTPQTVSISLPVVGGDAPEVALLADPPPTVTLPVGHGEIQYQTELPRFLFGGFEAGKPVGQIVYRMDGRIIATVPLRTANAVGTIPQKRSLWQKIRDALIH